MAKGNSGIGREAGKGVEPLVNSGEPWPDLDEAWARVRRMQAKLHLWATQDKGRVFDDLYNLVHDPAFLVHAWERVHGNKGGRTAGVDGVVPRSLPTLPVRFLSDLRSQVKDRTFRPQPVRERLIPKPGSTKKRRLGIPTAADRVVQASLKLVLEPIFEADFQPGSYGFRPKRRAQDAVAEIHHFATQGYVWVFEADIAACFDTIDHVALMGRVRSRVKDKRVQALIKSFLKAGILSEDGMDRDTHTGTPQGGILSPLLANIALSTLDDHFQQKWDAFGVGTRFPGQRRKRHRHAGGATYKLVRYADDFVILVNGTQAHAQDLWTKVADLLQPMSLTLSVEKTRAVHIEDGFDFLGWRIQRRTKAGTAKKVIYTYPSKKSLHAITRKVRTITRRSGSPYVSLDQLLKHLNSVTRGWCNYFRHGVSSATFRYLYHFMWHSVVRWLRARHPRLGWRTIQRRFLTGYPAHRPTANGITLYNPQELVIERYRWRGYEIPTPWTNLAKLIDTAQQA
ncbi:MAG: group II intron reverse transcriptase/maturase [Pseudonocardiaceae bacterium]